MVTDEDKKAAAAIIKRLTPRKAQHSKYLVEARRFIAHFNHLKSFIPKDQMIMYKLDFIKSEHFGLEYLVAFTKKNWFMQYAPTCNAAAAWDFSFCEVKAPPLVIVPNKAIPKQKGFRSILEHEFVHINQAILSEGNNLDSCELKNDVIFNEFMKHTLSEFEAHVVQLVHDQSLMPTDFEATIPAWCYLRAYTSSLEKILMRMIANGISENKKDSFFKHLKTNLVEGFEKNSLNPKMAELFKDKMDHFISTAIQNISNSTVKIVGQKI